MRKLMLVLVGLSVAPAAHAEPARDVAYYTANPKVRAAKIAQCNNDPGRLAKTPNCINAAHAQSRAIFNPANKGMFKVQSSRDAKKAPAPPVYTGKTY